jgi:predicted N-acetyltransferase YhbS
VIDQPQILVRPIEPGDAPDVFALIDQLGYKRPLDEVTAWIESLAEHATIQAALVACAGREVIGWIEVSIVRHLQSAPFSLIGGLVVEDGFRGRGVGLELCHAAEAWSWNRGVYVVRVTSRSTRLDAHRFYERNGYSPTKVSYVFEKKRPA